MYVYIYLSIYYLYIKTHEFTLPISTTPHLIFKSLFWQSEIWLSLSIIYVFVCSVIKYTESSFRNAKPCLCEKKNKVIIFAFSLKT